MVLPPFGYPSFYSPSLPPPPAGWFHLFSSRVSWPVNRERCITRASRWGGPTTLLSPRSIMSTATQNTTSPLRLGRDYADNALEVSIIVFTSIALYNAAELVVLIPLSFRHYRSLYFWSLLISASLGLIPFTIGSVLQFFHIAPLWLSVVFEDLGWVLIVPNQSVVLYSRLHLVSENAMILSFVRGLIALSLVIIVVPTITLHVGWTYIPLSSAWAHGFATMQRIQMTWFTAQETFISTVYIWYTVQMIRLIPSDDKRRHKILYELVAINVFAIIMDLSLVILQYLDFYYTQVILKATIYSIKLKLEFAVLGMLVSIVHRRNSEETFWLTRQATSNFS